MPSTRQINSSSTVRNGISISSLKINRAGYVERNVKARNTSFDMYYSPKSTSVIKDVIPVTSPSTPSQEKQVEEDIEK